MLRRQIPVPVAPPPDNNVLVFSSSSSHLLTTSFPRYTRFVRRFVRRLGLMHRIALVALFISVVLAFTLSLASRMSSSAPPPSEAQRRPLTSHSRFGSPHDDSNNNHLHHHHQQHHRHLHSKSDHSAHLSSSQTTSTSPSSKPTQLNNSNVARFLGESKELPNKAEKDSQKLDGYHFEDELIKTQADLQKLPTISWHYSHALDRFRPLFMSQQKPGKPTSGKITHSKAHLITLNKGCYCTRRNQFIVASRTVEASDYAADKKKKWSRLPALIFHHDAAVTVRSTLPKDVLFARSQKVVFVPGTTVLWRGRAFPGNSSQSKSHLQRILLPLRSVVDLLHLPKSASRNDDVYVAAENMDISVGGPDGERLDDYYLGDIPKHRRLSLSRLRPRLVCFHRVVALGSEYEGSADPIAHDRIKSLIEQRESLQPNTLSRICSDDQANRNNVWIVHRQDSTTKMDEDDHPPESGTESATMRNVAQVETAVNYELIRYQQRQSIKHFNLNKKLNLGEESTNSSSPLSVRLIQAPNAPCPIGSAREGCYDSDCTAAHHSQCNPHMQLPNVVQMYNNMTLLITTSGTANLGFAFMPRGSHVIEVVPYGVLEPSYEEAARAAGLSYHRLQSKLSKRAQRVLFQRFGDVANSPIECWSDAECRQARLHTETVVDVKHLGALLRTVLSKWARSCSHKVGRKKFERENDEDESETEHHVLYQHA